MIKWAGYGKSLKLLFFGLLISCFTLLGNSFVSADNYAENYSLPANFYSNSINNIIGKDLSFESVGSDEVSHNWLYYQFGSNGSNARKYTFWNNGKLYFYADINESNSYYQGYYSCACKNVSQSGFALCLPYMGCDSSIVDEFYNLQDYNFTEIWVYPAGGLTNLCIYNSNNFTTYCFGADFLTGSLGLPDNIIDISEYAEDSIFSNGNVGSSVVNNNSVITGDFVYSECTVGEVKQLAEKSGMNPYVCYAGLNISDTGFQVGTAGTGSSVFELFQSTNDGKNFRDWFDYRDTIFDNRFVYSDTIRQNQPSALYSYFNFYNQYGPEFGSIDIENYCRIIVNNLSESSKWTGLPSLCPIVSGPYINNGLGVDSSGEFNGNVAVGVNRDGVGNMSGTENKDAITFIQDFFNKAKSVIPTDYNGVAVGVLPTYIILFLCAIILFRFISH